ncbi:polysaccharide deacetylase family protein [Paucibacter sp. AS339]|uniref:polysaccharide deacetylase family protein n=1 Tax=Paucibacter hankyongi TaxID=3133434 RepID=UPI00309957E7
MPFEQFSKLIDVVRTHFNVVPLSEAIDDLRAGLLRQATVAITFDDGHESWVSDVLPFLLSRGLRATFFVSTGQLGGPRLWNERVQMAVDALPIDMVMLRLRSADMPNFPVEGDCERREAIAALTGIVKYFSIGEREKIILELEELAAVDGFGRRFNEASVIELNDAGMEIGCHTENHPILTLCTHDEALKEIRDSKLRLERIIREPVLGFAYPNGRPGLDYGYQHVEMVESLGFRYAVSTEKGFANGTTPWLQIPRFTPWRHSRLGQLAQLVHNLVLSSPACGLAVASPKAVTMVAFHFPPQAGSSGILRTLNFVRELPLLGWRVGVVSACPQAYERVDPELAGQIPSSVTVTRPQAFDSKKVFSIKGRYPEFLALPDRWWTWFFAGRKDGARLSQRLGARVIWSTYPILTSHLIAAGIARRLSKPWVAEFRDPAFHEEWGYGLLRAVVLRFLEAWVVRRCTLCVLATESTRKLYARRYPDCAEKLRVIPNGFDEQAFNDLLPQRFGVPDQRFLVLHSGAIYPRERDPTTFFLALRTFMQSEGLNVRDVLVRFRASGADQSIAAIANDLGLAECIEFSPAHPYRAALSEMMGSDLLLVFQGTAFNNQIPAKVYEYLRAFRPVFAVVDPVGATAELLRDHQGVLIADCSDVSAIAVQLTEAYRTHAVRLPGAKSPVRSRESVAQYSRQYGAKALSDLLGELCGEA